MSPRKLASILTVVVAVAVAGGAYVAWTRSPRYALREASHAARQHDLATFQEYVDTEKLAGRFVDDFLSSITDDAKNDQFGGLAVGMAMLMRPQMAKAAQEALERGIESGTLETDNKDGGNPARAAKQYWSPAGAEQSGYRGITYIKKQGKVAIAGLEIFDADLRRSFTVDLKLRDLGNRWQIVEIANVKGIQRAIQDATRDRLAEMNKPIDERLKSSVRFDSLLGHSLADSSGSERRTFLSAQLRNLSTKTIQEIDFAVRFIANGEEIGKILCSERRAIGPGDVATDEWWKDTNQFVASDMKLFNGIDRATAVPEVTRLVFDDGSTLEHQMTVRAKEKAAVAN
jgi:Flp pilus assembly protein TadG